MVEWLHFYGHGCSLKSSKAQPQLIVLQAGFCRAAEAAGTAGTAGACSSCPLSGPWAVQHAAVDGLFQAAVFKIPCVLSQVYKAVPLPVRLYRAHSPRILSGKKFQLIKQVYQLNKTSRGTIYFRICFHITDLF